jgi:chromosomal replication initiation ATPase DnaA
MPGRGDSVLLDGRFRFDNFVVGSANRLAVAAASAVAESPGTVYNPLFMYSGSGLGKTHLIGAIGHAARVANAELRVVYIPLDDFVDDFHLAISSGQADAFKERYQAVDLLLLDDVQFLTGRRETQSEMLRIFNALQATGRQIVMASDRAPTDISDVDERLLTRLTGGLIVDIGVPEYETRVAILRPKCEERSLHFDAGVLEELARLPLGNVRELQGALNRVVAHQSLLDQPMSAADVRQVLGALRTPTPAPVVISDPEAAPLGGAGDEFQSFLSDVTVAVAQSVDSWRVRLGARIAHWQAAGFRTTMLEQALARDEPPDLDALESAFAEAAARLELLEAEVVLLDAALAGDDVFRDPLRLAEAEAVLERAQAAGDPPPGPAPAWTMATFVQGESNRMAVRAADAVLAEPGARYNPLFIHGPTGTGKSHLAHAIGNALYAANAELGPAACVTADEFVDGLIAAIQSGTVEQWRARYRQAGSLIVDDVQELAGKERSQDELFHLFNLLHQSGRQVVLTSDRAPAEIPELVERLRSRFDGGLVVAVELPTRELREALFSKALAARFGSVDEGVATLLAEPPLASATEIEAMVERVAAVADATGSPVNAEVVARAVGVRRPTPAFIPVARDAFFLDLEKVVVDWPGVDGRIIEELA